MFGWAGIAAYARYSWFKAVDTVLAGAMATWKGFGHDRGLLVIAHSVWLVS